LELERFGEAADVLRRGLVASPDVPALYYRLGRAEHGLGNAEPAIEALRKAIPERPADYPEPSVLLARIYNAQGRHQDAESLLTAALSPDYPHAFGYMILGQARLALGQGAQAVEAFREAVERAADNPLPQLYLGLALQRTDRQQEALAAIEAYLQAEPSAPLGRYARAASLYRLGRYAEALADYQALAEALPENPMVRRGIADCYAAQGRAGDAVPLYEQLVAAADAPADVYVALASAYKDVGQPDAAMETLRAFVQRYPERFDAQLALGAEHTDRGDYVKAAEHLGRASMLAPDNPLVIRALSRVYLRQGRYADAAAEAERLVELTGGDPSQRLYLGTLYEAAGRQAEAMTVYETVLKAQPDDPLALNNLAMLLAETEPARALELARRAAQLAPGSVTVADTLGWVSYKSGRLEDAHELLEAAAQKAPDYPPTQYHLGIVNQDLGNTAAARRHFERFLALSPKDDRAPEVEALLQGL
jgi:tetratricopeptide (TPR) repeat protein